MQGHGRLQSAPEPIWWRIWRQISAVVQGSFFGGSDVLSTQPHHQSSPWKQRKGWMKWIKQLDQKIKLVCSKLSTFPRSIWILIGFSKKTNKVPRINPHSWRWKSSTLKRFFSASNMWSINVELVTVTCLHLVQNCTGPASCQGSLGTSSRDPLVALSSSWCWGGCSCCKKPGHGHGMAIWPCHAQVLEAQIWSHSATYDSSKKKGVSWWFSDSPKSPEVFSFWDICLYQFLLRNPMVQMYRQISPRSWFRSSPASLRSCTPQLSIRENPGDIRQKNGHLRIYSCSLALEKHIYIYISYMDCHLSQFIPIYPSSLLGFPAWFDWFDHLKRFWTNIAAWLRRWTQYGPTRPTRPGRKLSSILRRVNEQIVHKEGEKKEWLVGGFNGWAYPSEKYDGVKVNGKDDIPWLSHNMMENKKCLKPPTRWAWSWHPSDPSEFGDSAYDTPVAKFLAGCLGVLFRSQCKTSLDANAHVVAVRTSEYEFLQSSVWRKLLLFKAGHCQANWEPSDTLLAESTHFAQSNVSRLPCSLSQRVDRTCCLHIGFLAPWRISLSTRTNSVKS